ncbi:MAG: ATP-binding protein [Gammaproteobacteria bacterium]
MPMPLVTLGARLRQSLLQGIRARVFWAVAVLMVLLAGALTAASVYQRATSLQQQITDRGLSVTRGLARASELGVLTGNDGFLAPVMEGALAEPDMVAVAALDAHAAVIRQVTAPGASGQLLLPLPDAVRQQMARELAPVWREITLKGVPVYQFWAPVVTVKALENEALLLDDTAVAPSTASRTLIGYVTLTLSLKGIHAKTQEALVAALVILALFLPLSLIIAYLLANGVTRPLAQLVQLTQAVGQGDLTQRIDVDGNDEVAQLATSFNGMIAQIRERDQALRAAHDGLERRVAERTAELARNNAVLERRNRDLDQFAYVAAHDLKTPLRGISNLASWIAEDIGVLLSADGRTQMQLLQARVLRAENLIDALREYTRAGRSSAAPQIVDSRALVEKVIGTLAVPPGFTIAVATDMPRVETVPEPLARVFAQLIGNAIRFHHRSEGRIEVGSEDGGDQWIFTVTDDGPGIAPQFHGKVFEIFQTLHAKDTMETTGVGLPVVKKIVEEHGGRISVASDEGRGATFRFTWPKDGGKYDEPASAA